MTSTSQPVSSNKLTRQQLEIINRRTIQYPLQIAEKDYFLALAIQLVSNSHLKHKLVFKGGTALHHCYLPQLRFSEDLDFTSLDPNITFEEINDIFVSDGTFLVNKFHHSSFTIKIERLQYQGLLGQPGNIKFEVDYHQNVILPGKETTYTNVWRINTSAFVMDPREICAEKIRAVSQRARYRDFYDLYMLLNELKIDLTEALQLLKQKEIRAPILTANIARNWFIAQDQIMSDLGSIYCAKEIANREIEKIVQKIHFEDILPPH